MKQETKELLEWIEKQINLAGTIVTDVSQPYWQEDCKKALEFLYSLPEIESKLCRGGYIQDCNGIPCCDGDTILIHDDPEKEKDYSKGMLCWSVEDRRFYFKKNDTLYLLTTVFEKVEK